MSGQLLFEQLLGGSALLCGDGENFADINLLKVFVPDGVQFSLIDYVFAKGVSGLYIKKGQFGTKITYLSGIR